MKKESPINFISNLLNYTSKFKTLTHNIQELGSIEIGATPRVKEFEHRGMTLYRYKNTFPAKHDTPILFVYSLINRPELADLATDRSLVRELCDLGYPVYLIDWGDPRVYKGEIGLETYILDYLGSAVDYLTKYFCRESIHFLGLCQGGTFVLCYASLFPKKVLSLTTTATPVDFHCPSDRLSNMVRNLDLDLIRDFPEVVDGRVLNSLFLFLKPYKLMQEKYINLLDNSENKSFVEEFFRMEKWIFDSPVASTKVLKEFVNLFYQKNSLYTESLFLDGRLVKPSNIKAPILNIFAKRDHIVPTESSRALARVISHGDYTEVELNCGHVGIYVGKSSGVSSGTVIGDWMERLKISRKG